MSTVLENLTVEKMTLAIDAFKVTLSKLRTGRAQSSLLDQITVDYYGTSTPLSQMSNIVVEDSRTLTVQPFDQTMTSVIEKAIRTSHLDLNPTTQGNLIRIPLPSLTEERRIEFAKHAKQESENSKISIRNIRRDINQMIKKNKVFSEDDAKREEDKVQKSTDKYIELIEKLASEKEKELMSV